jgi:hypothetical protein
MWWIEVVRVRTESALTVNLSSPRLYRFGFRNADRSCLAAQGTFHFFYRGPASQETWNRVLGLKVGELKVLPRMPMIRLCEPISTKLLLCPLRATGGAVQTIANLTMSIGKGPDWFGHKIAIRIHDEDRYMLQADYETMVKMMEEGNIKKKETRKLEKHKKGFIPSPRMIMARKQLAHCAVVKSVQVQKEAKTSDQQHGSLPFNIFNDGGRDL